MVGYAQHQQPSSSDVAVLATRIGGAQLQRVPARRNAHGSTDTGDQGARRLALVRATLAGTRREGGTGWAKVWFDRGPGWTRGRRAPSRRAGLWGAVTASSKAIRGRVGCALRSVRPEPPKSRAKHSRPASSGSLARPQRLAGQQSSRAGAVEARRRAFRNPRVDLTRGRPIDLQEMLPTSQLAACLTSARGGIREAARTGYCASKSASECIIRTVCILMHSVEATLPHVAAPTFPSDGHGRGACGVCERGAWGGSAERRGSAQSVFAGSPARNRSSQRGKHESSQRWKAYCPKIETFAPVPAIGSLRRDPRLSEARIGCSTRAGSGRWTRSQCQKKPGSV